MWESVRNDILRIVPITNVDNRNSHDGILYSVNWWCDL